MPVIRVNVDAISAVGLAAAVLAAIFVPSAGYCQAAGQQWTASMQGAPSQPAAKLPAIPVLQAAPAAEPAAKAPDPAKKPAVPPAKKIPAKDLFGAVKQPANLAVKSIGFYARGCLAGGKPLAVNGPGWQVMRLSRNRIWGHPVLIQYIERFAQDAKEKDGWPGLLVGDLSMPRGGPMPFGHASHQVGLDVDIWYRSAPDRELTSDERENIPMETFLLDPGHVNPAVWKPEYEQLLRRSVSYPEVARIFVNPAIKKWLCDNAKGDRTFLTKITPIMGHDDHFHVRLACPAGNPGCENQVFKTDEGCGKGLDQWIAGLMKPVKGPDGKMVAPTVAPVAPVSRLPSHGVAGMTMAQLPAECEAVLKAAPAAAAAETAMQ